MSDAFQFFSGDDDFLLSQRGEQVWLEWIRATGADEYGREVFDGRVNNQGDLESLINNLRLSLQSMSLFGGCKIVWVKNFSALADSVTGRAQGTLDLLEGVKDLVDSLDPASARLLVTATPVDRRRAFYKWIFKAGDGEHLSFDGKDFSPLYGLISRLLEGTEVRFEGDARDILIGKVSAHARVVQNETEKLITLVGPEGVITEAVVHGNVPVFGDTDFFEAAEVFYRLDLAETLTALDRHFFSYNDARGLISNLQGRNRLLIQLRALLDGGALRVLGGGRGGVDKKSWEGAAARYGSLFGDGGDKSGFNIFSQNAWYAGRLADTASRVPLKKLIDFQLEFARAFEGILQRPNDQAEVMRETAVRCLG